MDELSLGDREVGVIGVLWDIGDGTVTEVRDRLPVDLAYTTVLTILRKLEAKGLVRHTVEGKAHRYIPRVAQKSARRTVLGRLIDKLFDGSPEQLLGHLGEAHTRSPAAVKRMRQRLAATKKKAAS